MTPEPRREIETAGLSRRERYQLLTTLVVPRPIGWISTWNEDGGPNLAPYSFFNALSSHPALVGVSIGARRDGLKDTLVNVRERGAFCVNVVTSEFLDEMNETSAEVEAGVDEFRLAGLEATPSERVDAPYVVGCPAVLECVVRQEIDLYESSNVLVVGEVVGVTLESTLPFADGTLGIEPEALRPVGRLGMAGYAMPGVVRVIPRP